MENYDLKELSNDELLTVKVTLESFLSYLEKEGSREVEVEEETEEKGEANE